MAKIIAPNPDFTGVSASLHFVKGEAETEDEWLLQWFKSKGYEVEEQQDSENPQEPEEDLGDLEPKFETENLSAEAIDEQYNKDEIKARLDELEIEYKSSDNKESLIELLKASSK
ncbi:hypothetical protein Pryu01_03004 [Paraliobacillus ryukyuensis]|uniref:HeH/LEM domain-containing protein n=1 Tax=Paraliobacillus ryukyuensis TaxID=200904 RepID=A0A366DS17_9BACI|nr:hypothetical protein [Paraliobacillus ryukyuensis]RBO92064.1 hypothetical protein DES48_11728 [Paraliobacillus ryukyuensis]